MPGRYVVSVGALQPPNILVDMKMWDLSGRLLVHPLQARASTNACSEGQFTLREGRTGGRVQLENGRRGTLHTAGSTERGSEAPEKTLTRLKTRQEVNQRKRSLTDYSGPRWVHSPPSGWMPLSNLPILSRAPEANWPGGREKKKPRVGEGNGRPKTPPLATTATRAASTRRHYHPKPAGAQLPPQPPLQDYAPRIRCRNSAVRGAGSALVKMSATCSRPGT